MKVHLWDMEGKLEPGLLESSQELVKSLHEFDVQQVEAGYFHCISRQPDFHVEIRLLDDGIAQANCHCAVFLRSRKCRHVVAGLLLTRDVIIRSKKQRKRTHQQAMDDVLKQVTAAELRSFLSNYARSHASLRAEILANYLHLTGNPDYHNLFHDIAPIDKYGQLRVNRNNIKTLRTVSSTLLKKAQELIREDALFPAFSILQAVLSQLHRIRSKLPAFQDQVDVELKTAYKTFEGFALKPMAPRLQQELVKLAIDLCEKNGYRFPPQTRPLLQYVELFILDKHDRKEALHIVTEKIDQHQDFKWVSLMLHWQRIWKSDPDPAYEKIIRHELVHVVPDFYQHNMHEDVLYALQHLPSAKKDKSIGTLLQTGLKSAKAIHHTGHVATLGYTLSLEYFDYPAWLHLADVDMAKAIEVCNRMESLYPAGQIPEADDFLMLAWNKLGDTAAMLRRLIQIGSIEKVMEWDDILRSRHHDEISDIYAGHILHVRDAYGGIQARQKLNNIFSHLKSAGLTEDVAAKIKSMEKSKNKNSSATIEGFVFDLDGVIVDTAVHHFSSWREIMKSLGADILEEDDHHTRGAGRMESLEYLLSKYGIALSTEEKAYWANKKNEVYLQAIESITPDDLLPGTVEFLKASKQLGLKIALGSASKNANAVLAKLGIVHLFDAIMDGHSAKASKPDPEIFIKACEALGLSPEAVVVFEDAAKGVDAAIAAGCHTVGIGDSASLHKANLVVSGLDVITPTFVIESIS